MHLALLAVSLAAAPATPPKARPYSIHTQVALRRLQHFDVSPDGTKVAFAVRATDVEANRGRSDLFLVGTDGQGLTQLTSHPENDGEPTFGPDGRAVYFLSSRSGTSQVWRIEVAGGEAQQVTRSPVDVESFVLSRDGALLAFAAATFPDCDSLTCTQQRLEAGAKQKATGKLYQRLFVRHWDTWKDGRRSHLFVQPTAGGPAVDALRGLDADAPPRPFGGAEGYTFTPDGKGLVFAAREGGRQEAWSTDVDLFVVGLDGKGPPRKLTTTNRATDDAPVFSPDGTLLAYLAMSRPGYEADRNRVLVRRWPSGEERELARTWDRSAQSLTFSPDGKTLYVLADDVGQRGVFAVDVASGAVETRLSQGSVAQVAPAAGGLVVSLDALDRPADLFLLPAAGGEPRALTALNQEALAGVQLGKFEQFSFQGWNGATVHGYVVHPVGFDPRRRYPVAFLIHGGPQGSFGNHFHYRWNPQVYAGAGYGAVMIDFHGSTGYGQAFTDAIRGDWGGKPLEDLKLGLAAALKRAPHLDGQRACALGASYGGYMVNLIAGAWNEPWKCLVSHSGNLDERFAYFDTEELWFPEWEHQGVPWENPEGYQRHNPIDLVKNWRVPMLVIHGARDYRVVDVHALASFTALQRRGIESQLLLFPDENHWILKPANSVQWHEAVLGWLGRWTGAKAAR